MIEEEVVLHAMRRSAQMQAFRTHRLCQIAYQIAVWSHLHGCPIRKPGIVHGKPVMMLKDRDHVFRPGVFEEPRPSAWIELLRLEFWNEILIAEFVLRAVRLKMMFVLGR